MLGDKFINPFMQSGLFYLKSLGRFISSRRGVWLFLALPVFNVNSVDPDQTPRSAASDRCLHCLPVSL